MVHRLMSVGGAIGHVALASGGGIGSLLGARVRRPLLWAPLATIVLAVAWHLLWPALTGALQGSPLAWRLALSALSMVPLTLVLGMQFPAGLKQLAGDPARVAAAWATIAGC